MSSSNISRTEFYQKLNKLVESSLSSSPTSDAISCMSNISSIIFHQLQNYYGQNSVNWCGFYLVKQPIYQTDNDNINKDNSNDSEIDEPVLILGPFHGQPAVTLIHYGRGVCGTSLKTNSTQLIPNVHEHPNHIACDSRSQSEIVIPVYNLNQKFIAMIDIDSPIIDGFNIEDKNGLEKISSLLTKYCDWDSLINTVKLAQRFDPDDVTCPSKIH